MEELTPERSDTWVETANCNGLFHLAPERERKKKKEGKEHSLRGKHNGLVKEKKRDQQKGQFRESMKEKKENQTK